MTTHGLKLDAGVLLDHYLRNSSLALIAWDEDVRFITWSAQAEALFGWRADEVIGKTMDEIGFIHPDDVGHVAAAVRQLLGGDESWNSGENRNVHKDGHVIWCRWYNAFISRVGFRGFISLAEDMTHARLAHDRLEQSEERFRALFDNHPDAMLSLDAARIIRDANAVATRTLRGTRDLVGRRLSDLVAPIDAGVANATFDRALAGEAGGAELLVAVGPALLPTFVTMIPAHHGGSPGVHLHVRDRRGEIEQGEQNARHAGHIRDLYLSAAAANQNAERQIAATLEAGCRILGLTSGALYEAETGAIVASYGDALPLALARLGASGDAARAFDAQALPAQDEADGEPVVALIATPILTGEVTYGGLTFAARRRRERPFDDVDHDLIQLMGALVGSAIERGRSRARLQTLAYTDAVTALPNRAWLIEHLRVCLAEAAQAGHHVGVLFLDLDRFKDINDTLGHESGDRLLGIVGQRLAGAIRHSDCVARMGGDEFVVLALDSPDAAALTRLAERIIHAVEEPIALGDTEQFVTTSIGLASFPDDGRDAETLVKHADVAMYRAKDRGRNTYQFFTPALNATLRSRLTQERTLRRALENRELVVHYQPQHDLVSGEIVAVEALVRWEHPRQGLILPGSFIPAAEATDLIVAIGDYVLETACADIAALRTTLAPHLTVAVNLSARQFHHQHLTERIEAVLAATALDPTALELEITESVAMNDAAAAISIMTALGDKGVLFSVDDFGTGYSSLGYLRRFPLDSLKIDRSFVAEIANEPDDATIVRTIVAMAHALDLEVVAEGVETDAQLRFLRELRCDRVQGFYYSPALSRRDLEAYVRRGLERQVRTGT